MCLRGADGIGVGILVRQVDHLADSRLDNYLGALVTGEKGRIDGATGKIAGHTVEDGVEFRVADVWVFGVQKISLAAPGQGVIGAAGGESVVPYPDDAFLPR
jgi:hypothetical protein